MWWQVHTMKLLMHSSLANCYFLRLKSEYLPQHPVLGYAQPVFLPEFEIPRFTSLQNKGPIYSLVRCNTYILTWRICVDTPYLKVRDVLTFIFNSPT
jgi:hypothetical protein